VALLMAIAAVSVISLSLAARPSMASGPSEVTIQPAMLHRLTVMSLRGARLSGEPRPQWIKVVATSRATALREAMQGDIVPGAARQQAYLVVMKGHFTIPDAAPPHGRAPKGTYMTVTLDTSTLQTMDIGLSNRPPNWPLPRFGHAYSLLAGN
jgi:hypothetical protein